MSFLKKLLFGEKVNSVPSQPKEADKPSAAESGSPSHTPAPLEGKPTQPSRQQTTDATQITTKQSPPAIHRKRSAWHRKAAENKVQDDHQANHSSAPSHPDPVSMNSAVLILHKCGLQTSTVHPVKSKCTIGRGATCDIVLSLTSSLSSSSSSTTQMQTQHNTPNQNENKTISRLHGTIFYQQKLPSDSEEVAFTSKKQKLTTGDAATVSSSSSSAVCQWYIQDQSVNGIWLNGKRIPVHQVVTLASGDIISFGQSFTCTCDQSQATNSTSQDQSSLTSKETSPNQQQHEFVFQFQVGMKENNHSPHSVTHDLVQQASSSRLCEQSPQSSPSQENSSQPEQSDQQQQQQQTHPVESPPEHRRKKQSASQRSRLVNTTICKSDSDVHDATVTKNAHSVSSEHHPQSHDISATLDYDPHIQPNISATLDYGEGDDLFVSKDSKDGDDDHHQKQQSNHSSSSHPQPPSEPSSSSHISATLDYDCDQDSYKHSHDSSASDPPNVSATLDYEHAHSTHLDATQDYVVAIESSPSATLDYHVGAVGSISSTQEY